MANRSDQPRRLDEATRSLRSVAVCHLIVEHGGVALLTDLRQTMRRNSDLDDHALKRAVGGDIIAGRIAIDGVGLTATVRVANRDRWKR